MARIRWFDAEANGPSSLVAWPVPATILAVLFLNFQFLLFIGDRLWMSCPLPVYAVLIGIVALLVAGAFFVGPALAIRAARCPLFGAIENSLGSILAIALRVCCVVFLVCWIASLVALMTLWGLWKNGPGQVSSTEYGVFGVAVLVFVFATGLQSIDIETKLAVFTNKLAVAILIAALIRVREGWWAIPVGLHLAEKHLPIDDAGDAMAELSLYVSPLALLAADFGLRCRSRAHVAMTGLMGAAVPLFGVLLLVGAIGVATGASSFYLPSLTPDVAMALWSHAAHSAMPGGLMIAGITLLGALRFGARALTNAAAIRIPGTRRDWTLVGCFVIAPALLSLIPFDPVFERTFHFSARCLVVTSAVLMGDCLMRSPQSKPAKRIDAVGILGFLSGMATPLIALLLPAESTPDLWGLWFLQSYGVTLLVCLLGRTAQRLAVRRPIPGSRTRQAPDSSSPNPI